MKRASTACMEHSRLVTCHTTTWHAEAHLTEHSPLITRHNLIACHAWQGEANLMEERKE